MSWSVLCRFYWEASVGCCCIALEKLKLHTLYNGIFLSQVFWSAGPAKKILKSYHVLFQFTKFSTNFYVNRMRKRLITFFPNPTPPQIWRSTSYKNLLKNGKSVKLKENCCRKFYFCGDNFSESFSSNLDDFFVLSKMFRRFRKSMRIEKNIKKLRRTSSRFIEAVAGIRTRDLLSCFGVEIFQSPYRWSEARSSSVPRNTDGTCY